MNTRPSRIAFAFSSTREHVAAVAMSAMVTLTVLSSVGNVADRQYENALVAQPTVSTLIAANRAAPAHRLPASRA